MLAVPAPSPGIPQEWLEAVPAPLILLQLQRERSESNYDYDSTSTANANVSNSTHSTYTSTSSSASQSYRWRALYLNESCRNLIGISASDELENIRMRFHVADRDSFMVSEEDGGWKWRARIRMAGGAEEQYSHIQFDGKLAPGFEGGASASVLHCVCSMSAASRRSPLQHVATDPSVYPIQQWPVPAAASSNSNESHRGTASSRLTQESSVPLDLTSPRSSASSESTTPNDSPNVLCTVGSVVGTGTNASGARPPFRRALSRCSNTLSSSPSLPIQLSAEATAALHTDWWSVLPVLISTFHCGRFVRANPQWEVILGWREEELKSMSVADVFHPEDIGNVNISTVQAAIQNSMGPDSGTTTDIEPGRQTTDTVFINRLRHKHTGEYIPCVFRMALSKIHYATPSSLIQGESLMTPRAAASSTIVEAEPFVHGMGRPMYNKERAALSAALDSIAQQKQEFISNITHELQTPMNGICASAEMLGSTELTAEQTDLVNCIQISSEVLTTIISDIVSFSSIDKGSLVLETKPVVLNAVIEEAVTLCFRPKLHDHLEIIHSLAADLPSAIIGDVARIRQVLIHQISNALKFTRQGSVHIRVCRYDSSLSPAQLILAQSRRQQYLQDELASGTMSPEVAAAAQAELAAPPLLVIEPPAQLPSLFNSDSAAQSNIPATSDESSQRAIQPSPSEFDSQPVSPNENTPFTLLFAISDTGVGIDARYSSRLFQIFSQVDSTFSKEHQGTGIGLLTSLKLCRAMGGDMWCSSVLGRGTTFYFSIRCTPAGPVTQPTPLQSHSSMAPSHPSHHPSISFGSLSVPAPFLMPHLTPLSRVRNIVQQENRHVRSGSVSDSSAHGRISSSVSSVDSPGSTSSISPPHRSPLIAPRFVASFHTVGVVWSNTLAREELAADLRLRGATVRTFASSMAALADAQQHLTVLDCYIVDSLCGMQVRAPTVSDSSSSQLLNDATLEPCTPGDFSGIELIARLLELRDVRERQRVAAAPARILPSIASHEAELRVVLLVPSFGLPSTLPMPESVINSAVIRLIQVHKPYKHQVLYDAIRTLADQLVLPISEVQKQQAVSPGSGYAMSLMQTKSKRTLTSMAMNIGGNSGESTSSWATRRIMLPRQGSTSYSVQRSFETTSRESPIHPFRQSSGMTVQVPSQEQTPSALQSAPLLPPSPLVPTLFPDGSHTPLSMSDSTLMTSHPPTHDATNATAHALPLPSESPPIEVVAIPSHNAAIHPAHTGVPFVPVTVESASATAIVASTVSVPKSARSPHITTGGSRLRTAPALSPSFATRWPLNLLVVEDNPINMKLLIRLLVKLGYSPEQAVDGREGSEKVMNRAKTMGRTYDIVLMDLSMRTCLQRQLRQLCSNHRTLAH